MKNKEKKKPLPPPGRKMTLAEAREYVLRKYAKLFKMLRESGD